jgi:hypothetical protein
MINFVVNESPDNNVITSFQFFQNQIYLGRTSGNLCIDDKSLRESHVMLEVIGKELLIHAQKDVDFFLINGKRASAIRKIKVNDQITIGQTVLKVLAFEETAFEGKKNILDRKLDHLIETNSPLVPVIEQLTKLMKQ